MKLRTLAAAVLAFSGCAGVAEEQYRARDAEARRLLEAYETARAEALERGQEAVALREQVSALQEARRRDGAEVAELGRALDEASRRARRCEPAPSL